MQLGGRQPPPPGRPGLVEVFADLEEITSVFLFSMFLITDTRGFLTLVKDLNTGVKYQHTLRGGI
jgi:hypothetical protein